MGDHTLRLSVLFVLVTFCRTIFKILDRSELNKELLSCWLNQAYFVTDSLYWEKNRSVIQTTVFYLDMSITEIRELEAYQIYVLVKKKVYPEVNNLRRSTPCKEMIVK